MKKKDSNVLSVLKDDGLEVDELKRVIGEMNKRYAATEEEKKGLKQEILKVINQTKEHPVKVIN